MTTIPNQNTKDELTSNEEQCYVYNNINSPMAFSSYMLYLPSFPREDVNAIVEIPFLLARQFAISVENYFLNGVELLIMHDYDSKIMIKEMRLQQSKKILNIKLGSENKSKIDLESLNGEIIISNLKNSVESINVEIFKNVPAISKYNLLNNSKYYLEIQCCWFINLLSFFNFESKNVQLRITESCCLNLNRLNEIFNREKEIIHSNTRAEVCRFLLAEFLVAIDYLHERGITHRFLHPDIIYIDFKGHLKIGDLFQSMNIGRDIMKLFENWSLSLEEEIGFSNRLHQNYMDPEILQCLLNRNKIMEAYMQMDCLSDVFAIAVIIIECLSGVNLLSIKVWNNMYGAMSLPITDHSHLVNIFLKPEMQMILRQHLNSICGFISPEFYALLLLMLQPKSFRMMGLRIHVQRHRYFHTSGCEYKLRLSLVKKHPTFKSLKMDNLIMESSPVTRLLTILNSS